MPFNISLPAQTTGGVYGWTGAGAVKPLTEAAFATVTLPIAKAAGIIVLTEELLGLATPGSETLFRDELVRGIASFLDSQFVDPAVAAVANVNPASVTNAAVAIPSSGVTGSNAATDLVALVRAFVTGNPDVESAVLVLSPANAMALSASGLFPDVRADGSGFLAGVRAITSAAAGDTVVMLDPSGILVGMGDITIDVSRHASVQMESTPDAPPTAATVQTSLWQHGLVGLKVDALANWKLARAGAVQYVSGASYA